jgi:hypothetical protein
MPAVARHLQGETQDRLGPYTGFSASPIWPFSSGSKCRGQGCLRPVGHLGESSREASRAGDTRSRGRRGQNRGGAGRGARGARRRSTALGGQRSRSPHPWAGPGPKPRPQSYPKAARCEVRTAPGGDGWAPRASLLTFPSRPCAALRPGARRTFPAPRSAQARRAGGAPSARLGARASRPPRARPPRGRAQRERSLLRSAGEGRRGRALRDTTRR